MKLINRTVLDFTELLGSDAPAPGGGSASALVGAQGAALCSMVCALSEGRKKYEEHEKLILEAREKSEEYSQRFLELIDEDTLAYSEVSAVFSMPRDTEEEKSLRKAAMQAALKKSTMPPLEMMKLTRDSLEWIQALMGKSNVNAVSDLGVAALCLKTAVQGAWLNVLINIGSIDDAAFVEQCKAQGEAVLADVLPLADKVYEEVKELL